MKDKVIAAYNQTQWFTDREAWFLFRVAAFGEAIGWSGLIVGILFDHYRWPNHANVLLMAGRIHGMLFFIYIAAAAALSKSLNLTFRQFVLAVSASVPPYASLVFEQLLARDRRKAARVADRQVCVRAIVTKGDKLLATLPKDRGFWCLPGGALNASESPEQGMHRLMIELTGHKATIKGLSAMHSYQHGSKQRLEFFFMVENSQAYNKINVSKTKRGKIELEEIRFVDPRKEDIEPNFIKSIDLEDTPISYNVPVYGIDD